MIKIEIILLHKSLRFLAEISKLKVVKYFHIVVFGVCVPIGTFKGWNTPESNTCLGFQSKLGKTIKLGGTV